MANSNNENAAADTSQEDRANAKKRVLPKDPLTGKLRPKTWKEKIVDGDPLNRQDETKADADFNFKERQRQAKTRAAFEASKNRGRDADASPYDKVEMDEE